MAGGHGGGDYKDLVVFLAAAGVVVPLFNRWKISPVLGFLAAGVLLGPDGLGRFADVVPWLSWLTIDDADQLAQLSELGVAFLLFMIGLELSWERLKAMRRLVFGLGLMQVARLHRRTGGGLHADGPVPGRRRRAGHGAGPVLDRRGPAGHGRAGTHEGSGRPVDLRHPSGPGPGRRADPDHGDRAGLAAPSRAATSSRGAGPRPVHPGSRGDRSGADLWWSGDWCFVPCSAPSPRAGETGGGSQEMFVALCLLVVVGAGVAAQAAGLSMSLGALVAGLLLAETEYRREVEINIEPFKGLLLGVFFVGVGIGLDLDAVAADPVGVFGLGLGHHRDQGRPDLRPGAAVGPQLPDGHRDRPGARSGGGVRLRHPQHRHGRGDRLSPAFTQGVLVSATISMFTVPLMAMLGQRIAGARRSAIPVADDPALGLLPETDRTNAAVLIVGFGRVGRLVGEMLKEHGQSFIAVDTDPTAVAAGRRDGYDVSYGDAARAEMLALCGIETIRALVVTMDAPGKVDEVVIAARALRDDLIVIARARDDRHAARLYGLGVTDAVPETTEASLQLAENTLVDLGVPMGLVLASIHERRDQFRGHVPGGDPRRIGAIGATPAPCERRPESLNQKRDPFWSSFRDESAPPPGLCVARVACSCPFDGRDRSSLSPWLFISFAVPPP